MEEFLGPSRISWALTAPGWLLLAVLLLMASMTQCEGPDFYGIEGRPVAFVVDVDPGGPVENWTWDFDADGNEEWTSPSDPNATWTYEEAGTHLAVLWANLTNGTRRSWIFEVLVEPLNDAPQLVVWSYGNEYTEWTRFSEVPFFWRGTDDGEIVLYEWDFDGDGTFDANATTDAKPLRHLYTELGTYNATLRATDDGGATATAVHVVIIVNLAPWVEPDSVTYYGDEETPLRVRAGDTDGEVVSYIWDFGDGSEPRTTDVPNTTHRYTISAVYNVTVTVLDDDGGSSTGVLKVNFMYHTVRPVLSAEVTGELKVGETLAFSAQVEEGRYPIAGIRWEFEDGTVVEGLWEFEHIFLEPGLQIVVVTTWDEANNIDVEDLFLEVEDVPNDPPVARPSVEQWVRPGRNLHFRQESHDPDGTIVLYRWDFDGDGTFDYSNSTSGNTTHVYPEEGIYVAVLQVTDNRGEVATATVTIKVSRDAPGEEEVDDTKGAAVCCAVTVVVLVIAAYWTMRRSLATPRKDLAVEDATPSEEGEEQGGEQGGEQGEEQGGEEGGEQGEEQGEEQGGEQT